MMNKYTGTLMETVNVLSKYGARNIYDAYHGILVGEAIERIKNSPIKELVVTNTVPVPKEKRDKLTVLSIAPTFGEAIKESMKKDH